MTNHPAEFLLRLLAIAVGLGVTLRSQRKHTRLARGAWRAFGVFTALVPCLLMAGETDVARYAAADVIEIALAGGVTLAVGSATLAVGLRGRRVGDHEHCRRCGFDLFGRPAGTLVCGECGAPLHVPRAIAIGERRRRPRLVLVGSFLVLVTLGYVASYGPAVARWYQRADLSRFKTAGRLSGELWGRNPAVVNRAWIEVDRRVREGTFGLAATDRLVADLLDRPSPSPSIPGVDFGVTNALGVVEAAWPRGEVSAPVARRALRAVAERTTLHVAPQASRGRTLRYWIAPGDWWLARDGGGLRRAATLAVDGRLDTLDGRPLPSPTWSALRGANEWPGLERFGNAFDLSGTVMPVGPATLRVRFRATLTLAAPDRPTLTESADLDLTGTTQIVEPATMACPPAGVSSPAVRRSGRAFVVASPATAPGVAPTTQADAAPSLAIVNDPATHAIVLALSPAPAAPVLADVALRRADGVERPLGVVYLEPGGDEVLLPLADGKPTGDYRIVLRAVPERGADLFRVVPVLPTTLTVSPEGIEDRTSAP